MTEVGYIVGEARTDEFTFVTSASITPPRLEYIVVPRVQERVDDELREVDVLAQVTGLTVSSRLLDTTMSYAEVEAILGRLGGAPPVIVGTAKVLGYLDDGTVRLPRHAATPGTAVRLAPDDLLQRFFSRHVASGVEIGTLINRPRVPVLLDPNGLRRHLAVIAQTGAGKSYTVGVILEKLLQLGATVIVFDPNSDYVLMRRDRQRRNTPFAGRVEVYRLPSEQRSRIPDADIGPTRKFSAMFSRLDPEELCDLAGIGEGWTSIRTAIRRACENLTGTDYTPKLLRLELERLAEGGEAAGPTAGAGRSLSPAIGDEQRFSAFARAQIARKSGVDVLGRQRTSEPSEEIDTDKYFAPEEPEVEATPTPSPDEALSRLTSRNGGRDSASEGAPRGKPVVTLDVISGAQKALKYVEALERMDIWGFEDVPMDDLLRPMTLSVIDLAGVDQRISEFVVDKILREAWSQASTQGLARPVFVVLEEAHNFVPGGRDTYSHCAYIIKRISSEGRKFGIFLVLITQRPYRIHQDTLSQCNSQIIMRLTNPEDQRAVRAASESISEGLLADLPGLNVGEAVVLGPLVRVPVMVRVGKRLSQEGGSDVDVVAALERARQEVKVEDMAAKAKAERPARTEREEEV